MPLVSDAAVRRSASAEALRRLAIGDAICLDDALHDSDAWAARCGLDDLTVSFARIAALVGLGAEAPSLQVACNAAMAQGASRDQVVGVLVAAGPSMGTARLMKAALRVGLALGVDVGSDLEATDDPW